MAGFYRKFLPDFSRITEPLTRLTKKMHRFVWDAEQIRAFEDVKTLMATEPVLRYPDYEKTFHIWVDASNVSQGAVLTQYDVERKAHYAIAYASRTMTETERKQSATDAEMGAIIFGIREFRGHTYGCETVVHTDHMPLVHALKKQNPDPKLARWIVEIQSIPNFKVVHVAGRSNAVADALSRAEFEEDGKTIAELQDEMEFPRCLAVNVRTRTRARLVDAQEPTPEIVMRDQDDQEKQIDVRAEQLSDPELAAIIRLIENNDVPSDWPQDKLNELRAVVGYYSVHRNGCLYRNITHAADFREDYRHSSYR